MKKIVSIFTILAIMLVSFNTDIKYEIKAKDSQIEQSYIVKTNNVKLIDKLKTSTRSQILLRIMQMKTLRKKV